MKVLFTKGAALSLCFTSIMSYANEKPLSWFEESISGNINASALDTMKITEPMTMGFDESGLHQVVFSQTNEGLQNANNGGLASFRMQVQRPGEYKVKILTKAKAPRVSHNSLYLSIGNQSSSVWYLNNITEDEYTWQEYSKTIRLAPGYHDLTLHGRESHTYIKDVKLQWVNEPRGDVFVFEAENTDYLQGGIIAKEDLSASNNQYIHSSANGSAHYRMMTDTDTRQGEFEVRMRVRASAASTIDIQYAEVEKFSLNIEPSEKFQWVTLPETIVSQGIINGVDRAKIAFHEFFLFTHDSHLDIDQVSIHRIEPQTELTMGEYAFSAQDAVEIVGFSMDDFSDLPQESLIIPESGGMIRGADDSGYMSYTVNIAEPGFYSLKALVSPPLRVFTTNHADFYITIGDLDKKPWLLTNEDDTSTSWQQFNWQQFDETFFLNAGSHRLTIHAGDDNLQEANEWFRSLIIPRVSDLTLQLEEYAPPRAEDPVYGGHTYYISSIDEFNQVILGAKPGDNILFTEGTYSGGTLVVPANIRGTEGESKQITIKPASPNSVTFTADTSLVINGSYITFTGFTFNEVEMTNVVYLAGSYNEFSHNIMKNTGGTKAYHYMIHIPLASHHNRISHNDISGSKSISINVSTANFGRAQHLALNHRIDHNYFHDIENSNTNGRESIKLGGNTAPYQALNLIVDHNTFEKANGDNEIISIKSNGATISDNLFLESDGELVLRHSSRSIIARNRIIGSRGIRVSGANNNIVNNYIHNETLKYGIDLTHGCDAEHKRYDTAQNNLIAHNTFYAMGGVRSLNLCKDKIYSLKATENSFVNNLFKAGASNFPLFNDQVLPAQFVSDNFFAHNIADISGRDPSSLELPPAGLMIDNLFIEETHDYFPLMTLESPAVDNAVKLHNVIDDIKGQLRGNNPDMGALEIN